MSSKWEISENGAAQMESLARKLAGSCGDLNDANKKLLQITTENPALGPHKKDIETCIQNVGGIAKEGRENTEDLAKRIVGTAGRIREIVAKKRFNLGN